MVVTGTDSGFRSSGPTQSFEALFFDIGTNLVLGDGVRAGRAWRSRFGISDLGFRKAPAGFRLIDALKCG